MHSNMQQLNTFAGAGQPTLVSYRILTEDDFVTVKELGNRCLPQRYHDDYWLGLVNSPETYTTFGVFDIYQDHLIGVVSVLMDVLEYLSVEYLNEVEKSLMAGATQVCYVCTLFIAHTSRSQGLGKGLLLRCIEHIRSTVPRGSVIYLHVQVSNQAAISMYTNLGFQQAGMLPGYYKESFDASPQNGSMDALIL
ncbi:hypothetical protein PENTCL1PPCAC_6173, partial [Pristionchus entomophagus]